MTSTQKNIAGAALVIAVGMGIFEAHQTSELHEQVQTLHQELLSLTEQLHKLEHGQDEAKHKLDTPTLSNQPKPSIQSSAKPIFPSKTERAALPPLMLEDELNRAFSQPSFGKREAAFEQILKSISPLDIPHALAYLATRPGMNGVESPLFKELASRWAAADPTAASAWANGLLDASTQKSALLSVLKGWSGVAPQAAATFAASLPAGDTQDAAVMKIVKEWSYRDARDAANWVSTFPEGKLRDKVVEPIIFWGSGQCPAAIADMLDAIGNDDLIKKHGERLANVWLNRDEAAARVWIESSRLPEEVKQRLLKQADEEREERY